MDIFKELQDRGLIYQHTDEIALRKRLATGPMTLYCGFDPTADSLHIGHLLPILVLKRFQLAGHKSIALVGGGTGLIGDPSGKAAERTLNPKEIVEEWAQKIKNQLGRFLDFEGDENPAILANNYDWLGSLQVIEFLRDIGKNFPLGAMLAKDAVESRMTKGISFTEFSYMILQSYDYLKLNEMYGCEMQIGGSDQWGNITAGIDLIRRTAINQEKETYGLTLPLVTKSDGTKFGKTESGAVWLDPEKMSPYKFYQFWLNTDDQDVVKFLKYFTFLTVTEIEELAQAVEKEPEKRSAQRALAIDMTKLVHGQEALERAEKISSALFGGGLGKLTSAEVEEGFSDVPSTTIEDPQTSLVDMLVQVGAVSSKRQAREAIENGAIYINDIRHTNVETSVSELERLDGKYLVTRRGKKNYYLIKVQ
ncbi:tyrosine--tRNA ligase [Desulfosporosinus sp. BICA1-9]|uniref:tyrosine--tRNA ligase n=1 Tax=Desulfosporosinus sp. BICA1-9 TaxID=1531958 RepID=UPI00054C04C7|nr:tyrosine--tRNA ligase [Desulfosporosinus sp. BICA1-9]KJS46693.1 MAG: tyrosine--tRNA ligase [Peptococcaceae bacterium BRH_c23]KJS83809.1 MAG: tyrosine--tRNA ligase [Desulfosporosinus sp. BICA1-9]HBW35047.1 tyrosine--tRNA ligase [Desulfosporosinus sp.]